jgi:trk system potassium uptake protein TrkH
VAETAMALWKLYVAFTLAEFVALRWAGMDNFEAACHAFSTMATGGFSTRNASIEAFASPTIEAIIIFFMLIAGASFTRHYRLLVERQPRAFFGDQEIQFYFALLAGGTLAIATVLAFNSHEPLEAGREALFQVVSIMTTTGFSTANVAGTHVCRRVHGLHRRRPEGGEAIPAVSSGGPGISPNGGAPWGLCGSTKPGSRQ